MNPFTNISIIIMTCVLCSFTSLAQDAQDSTMLSARQAEKFAQKVQSKAEAFAGKMEKHTRKSLGRMIRKEQAIKRKMSKINAVLGKDLFDYSIDSLKKLQGLMKYAGHLNRGKVSGKYFPYLDTLKHSINFIKTLKSQFNFKNKQGDTATSAADDVEENLSAAEKIDQYLKDRETVLREQLKPFPSLHKKVMRLQRDIYYYRERINEFKSILSVKSPVEKIVTAALTQLPAFQQYFSQHSDLSSIFSLNNLLPQSGGSIPVINGISSRFALQQAVATNAPASSMNINSFLTQAAGQAETMKDKLKNKLNELGGMKDTEIKDFKPNQQRTKSFWKRVEYNTDLQTAKSNNLFPATGNLGLMVGYKLNDKSSAGVGVAYRFGLGRGWKDIRLSHEGAGLRAYINLKLKGKFYIQGGSEWNYNKAFETIDQLKVKSAWQQSALLGLSKKYQFSKKIKGNIQVLYDFLYQRHRPATSPVLFRFGYGF